MKSGLKRYLQAGRDVLVWKLDGLTDYDMRRPLVPTGTNLLGLVKHMTGVEAGYLGSVFGRPWSERLPFLDDDGEWTEPNADMWARPEESADDIVGLYRRVWQHSDATIDELPLDTVGQVGHWPEGKRELSLQLAVVHVAIDTQRHAGQADIIRELIDGAIGYRQGMDFPAEWDEKWWAAHHERVDRAAHTVTARREIAASAESIFELIADPAQQPRWDGNDNLRHADPGQRVRAVGDVFTMTLRRGGVRDNQVVEFEEGRLMAWRPAPVGKKQPGHLWRWQLEPVEPNRTLVTHTYDWSALTDRSRFPRAKATTHERLMASLDRLAAAAAAAPAEADAAAEGADHAR